MSEKIERRGRNRKRKNQAKIMKGREEREGGRD